MNAIIINEIDGARTVYPSLREAAEKTGLSQYKIKMSCRTRRLVQHGGKLYRARLARTEEDVA